MAKLGTYNKNYNWIFLAIDLCSNCIFLKALKRKSKEDMTEAFEELITFAKIHQHNIEKIWSDRG